jgi:hypothetical protein
MKEYDFLLTRKWFSTKSTIGELCYFDFSGKKEFLCFILEDEARPPDVKIKGFTCIPAGDYKLRITESFRFNKPLPIIYNVETYQTPSGNKPFVVSSGRHIWEGIRIHPGNSDADTEGCLLPGEKGKDVVLNSRDNFWRVETVMKALMKQQNTEVLKLRIIHAQEL